MPVVEQLFCDKNGKNCVRKSFCGEYVMNSERQWVLNKKHDLKFCHGILGVNAHEYASIKGFARDVELWVKDTISKLERAREQGFVNEEN